MTKQSSELLNVYFRQRSFVLKNTKQKSLVRKYHFHWLRVLNISFCRFGHIVVALRISSLQYIRFPKDKPPW